MHAFKTQYINAMTLQYAIIDRTSCIVMPTGTAIGTAFFVKDHPSLPTNHPTPLTSAFALNSLFFLNIHHAAVNQKNVHPKMLFLLFSRGNLRNKNAISCKASRNMVGREDKNFCFSC